jgi:predicted Fe-S protein YdhL (DUF1289 family)
LKDLPFCNLLEIRLIAIANERLSFKKNNATYSTWVEGAMTQRLPFPFKEICKLDRSASVCTGCSRTLGEIAELRSTTASHQHEIVRRSSARMGSIAALAA